MLPDLSQLPPEAQKQIQQVEQQAQAQLAKLQETVTVEKVGALLKDQKTRPFTLEIETDSTIEPDQMAEKQHRVEFAGAMGPLLQQIMQAMTLGSNATEALGKFSAESLRYMAGGFKVDRRMDDAIDELAEQLSQYQPPPEPQQQGEDPEAAKMTAQAAMAEAQASQKTAEAAATKATADAQSAQAELPMKQQEAQDKSAETAAKIKLTDAQTQKVLAEIGRVQIEGQLAQEAHQVDTALAVQGEQRAAEQQAQASDMQEREFERSAETQKSADKRATAESAAKVAAMKSKKDG